MCPCNVNTLFCTVSHCVIACQLCTDVCSDSGERLFVLPLYIRITFLPFTFDRINLEVDVYIVAVNCCTYSYLCVLFPSLSTIAQIFVVFDLCELY